MVTMSGIGITYGLHFHNKFALLRRVTRYITCTLIIIACYFLQHTAMTKKFGQCHSSAVSGPSLKLYCRPLNYFIIKLSILYCEWILFSRIIFLSGFFGENDTRNNVLFSTFPISTIFKDSKMTLNVACYFCLLSLMIRVKSIFYIQRNLMHEFVSKIEVPRGVQKS